MREEERGVAGLDHRLGEISDKKIADGVARLHPEDDEIGSGIGEESFKSRADRFRSGLAGDLGEAVVAQIKLGVAEEEVAVLGRFFGRDDEDLGIVGQGERDEVVQGTRRSGTAVEGDEDALEFFHAGGRDREDGRRSMIEEAVERFALGTARFEMEGGLKSDDDEIVEDGRGHEFLGGDALVFGLVVLDSGGAADVRGPFDTLVEDVIGVGDLFLHLVDHERVVGPDRGDEAGADLVGVEHGDRGDGGTVGLREEAGRLQSGIGEDGRIEGDEDAA